MSDSTSSKGLLAITGAIYILLGLALTGAGAYLASLGGSLYYDLTGIGMFA